MTTDSLDRLIRSEAPTALITYLQSLSDTEKKALLPVLKKYGKELWEVGTMGSGQFGFINGSERQRINAILAAFVCMSRSEFERFPQSGFILQAENLNLVIDWYCPQWFNEYVNRLAGGVMFPYFLTYRRIMEIANQSNLIPGPALLAAVMPQMLFETRKNGGWDYCPENLKMYPITLKEHIWVLFELESSIHHVYNNIGLIPGEAPQRIDWAYVLKDFSSQQLIDRSRLLRECLLASNRNFNKNLSGWFAGLFAELSPTTEELLVLQQDLLSVLSSSHSKTVNTALREIKRLVGEADFAAEAFLETVPLLLASTTKATVSATVQICEALIKSKPDYANQIAGMLCQCFIHPHEEIQAKAAKLIARWGDPADEELRQEIAPYGAGMLRTSKDHLVAFFDNTGSAEQPEESRPAPPLEAAAPATVAEIPFPQSKDDLIFLASQAVDNNAPWHIDLLPAALIAWGPQLTASDIPRFEPAFQRAFKTVRGAYTTNTGNLDIMLSFFLIDIGNWLISRFPSESNSLRTLYHQYDGENGTRKTSFLVVPASGSYTSKYDLPDKMSLYQPHRQLLLLALGKIRSGDRLPMLCTPTLAPCWIPAAELAARLLKYQQAGQQPDPMDLQVAVSRVQRSKEPVPEIDLLTGEFQALMRFLLNESEKPRGPFTYKGAWMLASRMGSKRRTWPELESLLPSRKSNGWFNGQLRWQTDHVPHIEQRYNHVKRGFENVTVIRKQVNVYTDTVVPAKSGLQKWMAKLLPTPKEEPPLLVDYLTWRPRFIGAEYNDIQRILSLVPNDWEPLLVDIINSCLRYPGLTYEGEKRMTVAVLQFLYEQWREPGEMVLLFLSLCMLSGEKTVIQLAGEIWVKGVSAQNLDSAALGKMIGIHERIEFAPLKRLTDLVTAVMMNVSPVHNSQLMQLIEHLVPELSDEPVKNLRKLLEIYSELMAVTGNKPSSPAFLKKLSGWQGSGSLAKLIARIQAVQAGE